MTDTTPITPLITAAQAFPALERLVDEAEHKVWMSFRIFDPRTRLRDPGLRDRGLDTWADLLADVTARGVALRVLLADFDPIFAPDLHQNSWRAVRHLQRCVSGDAQILCAPHGQSAGLFWRLAMRDRLQKRLAEMRTQDPDDLTPVERAALRGTNHLRPVTIHQKFAVVDDQSCIIGGLDINERRFDTPDHDRNPEDTWHDVSVRADGAFCRDLAAHFADSWNAARNCTPPVNDDATPLQPPQTQPHSGPRLLRTLSIACPGLTRLGPRPKIRENETAVIEAIQSARASLYIETQFLRHRPVIDALVRAADHRDLNLILILPPFAERVLFGGDDGWDARHAHALQMRGLIRLERAYGARTAIIAPAQPYPADPDSPQIHGAGPVYVHSKVTLVDDRIGIVGSANLNGRSLRWDTEASIAFDGKAEISALRQQLAQKWLGKDQTGDPSKAATWTAQATRNAALPARERRGFVLPYPLEKLRRFSRLLPILPNDMF
ncbi:phospholipase D family protein [Marinovum sp. 2_MG-2023]|uniref:phospholipase D family protein n=1 Tax=unclassified Marinovum TaxID=2647166 RepID=UPI0026E1DDEA|nr:MULTISPECIES: phospholipase D family protein [unclassified Marinovum]MDO6731484.1 phospholipase D family protein [Marinovum sp. 2_MG-2023]MDO6780844.1 phospholipase D family protein [Marinovum sp. 1_MG-2023]